MVRNLKGLLRQWRSALGVLTTSAIFLVTIETVFFPVSLYAHEGNSDPKVVHACVQQGSQQVRIVGVNGSCTHSETAVHWAVVGPAGPQGPAGPAGATGPQGPAGATGGRGPAGPAGPQGSAGPAGPQGAQGPTGATGATGPTGAPGAPGADGKDGADGQAGPAGTPAMVGFNIATGLPEVRLGTLPPNQWHFLQNRVVNFNKTSPTSKLRITYQDTLGANASVHNVCLWHIVIDNDPNPIAWFSDGDLQGGGGWRMHNGTHMAWAFNVPAGNHQVRVEGFRFPQAADCISGWNNGGNFFSVEEIP